jgi:predicted DNA binding protein
MQEPLNSQPLTLEDWIVQNILKDEEFINVVKTDLWDRIEPYIDELKEKFGITEEELEALLEGYLRGYYDLPPETPDWVRDIIKIN